MTTPETLTAADKFGSSVRSPLLALLFLLVLSACGSDASAGDGPLGDEAAQTAAIDKSTRVGVGVGLDVQIGDSPEITFQPADERGDDPFVPVAEIAECRPEELIQFLDSQPAVATAWADAADVAVDAIAETIRSYEPVVLTQDTRVTNHAYRSGVARGFQATLAAGTAVLVDDAGIPRVRCACGNPLAEPAPLGETTTPDSQVPVTNTVPVTTTVPTAVPTRDFCTTWAALEPSMVGAPSDSSTEGMATYLNGLVSGFDQLIAAAQATTGFPADALTDLITYRDAIAQAALTPGDPGPGPEDVLVGMRVEEFLTTFCNDDAVVDDAPPVDGDDDGEATPDDGTSGNCGSLQFALLVVLAEELSIDHAATSQPYVAAMNALVNGFDPGPEFDVGDLSLMLANEEIGCQGAQAMQQLLTDLGWGDLIEGTELGA